MFTQNYITPFNRINKIHPLILGLLISVGSILMYFVFVGHPIWGTNDDVAMSMTAAGVWFSEQPSADLKFINPYYGWFISRLYLCKPAIPWYGISFITVIGLSMTVLNFAILRLRKDIGFLFLMIIATIVTILPSLWHLQFTVVAGLASIAGFILLLSIVKQKAATNKTSIASVLMASFLLLIGSMIREDSAFMVCVLFAPLVLVLFFESILSQQSIKSKWFNIRKLLLISIIVGSSITGPVVLEKRYYKDSPEWKEWTLLNRIKSEFLDSKNINYDENTKPIFNYVGWNKTDYDMIMSWQYIDPMRYSPEKFISFNHLFQKNNRNKNILSNINKCPKSNFANITNDIKLLSNTTSSLLFCIILFFLICIRCTKWNFIYTSTILLSAFAVIGYLYFGLNRAPFRVNLLLLTSVLWMFIFTASILGESSTIILSIRKQHKAIINTILFILLLVLVYKDFSYAKNKSQKHIRNQNILEERIEIWKNNLPPNSIIYSIGSSFPFEYHLPLKPFSYLQTIKGFIGIGDGNQSSNQKDIINVLGLSNDFYASLAQKKHVFIVIKGTIKESKTIALRNHYKERYGINLLLIKSHKLPHLYRMIFNPINEQTILSKSISSTNLQEQSLKPFQ